MIILVSDTSVLIDLERGRLPKAEVQIRIRKWKP